MGSGGQRRYDATSRCPAPVSPCTLDPCPGSGVYSGSRSRSPSPSPPVPDSILVGLNAVILAVTDETPRVLTLAGRDGRAGAAEPLQAAPGLDILPYGPLDPEADRTLELTLRNWVRERTGLELGYVEQLYTFGDRNRDPAGRAGDPRVISVAYLALVREGTPRGTERPRWRDCYRYLPWEDWREGRPELLDAEILPALEGWAGRAPTPAEESERRARIGITFGTGDFGWDAYRTLERYELLFEAGLVHESRPSDDGGRDSGLGHPMGLDHRRILATALGRVRGKLRYRPVVFELVPERFTLLRLQRVVEALVGIGLHKQNFRRLVERGGLVEGTGRLDTETGGRPAELFRFRPEVLLERRAPGLGIPGG